MFEANHNEFFNIWTDIAPLCYFFYYSTLIIHQSDFDQLEASDIAFIGAIVATVVQHTLSTISHTFGCLSADISTSIWCLDYGGIGCNFSWITAVLLLIAAPEMNKSWRTLLCCVAVHSILVLSLGVYLCGRLSVETGGPETNTAGRCLLFFSFPCVLVPHY